MPRLPTTPRARRDREPLWRHLIGEVLRHERQAQRRTLKEVSEAALISMPYLSELERGRKEASSEVLAAVARALGLSLAELLVRAHGRLAPPVTSVTSVSSLAARRRPGPAAPHDGRLSLAA
nr:helix-turn-helix transcriptional regulator [Streptomyces hainanensis]